MKGLSKEERTERLGKIQEMFQKAREYSDDKVQIAMQMYEMVSMWREGGREGGKSVCVCVGAYVHACMREGESE